MMLLLWNFSDALEGFFEVQFQYLEGEVGRCTVTLCIRSVHLGSDPRLFGFL